jgi:cobalamin biosynthesis protein CobW
VLLGFNAAVEDNLVSRPSHHDHEEEHDHDEDINSVQFCLDSPVDAQILTQRIKELVALEEIYRVKGFVNVANKPMRMVLQGVGDRFDSFFDRPWQSTETAANSLGLYRPFP